MKKIIINICLFFCALCFAVLISELFIRIVLPQYDPSGALIPLVYENGYFSEPKDYNGILSTNTGEFNIEISTNKYGFRDRKDIARSGEDSVFVLGDSYAYGWGVEESERFSNVLEDMINADVFNIGMRSNDLYNYKNIVDYAVSNGANINNLVISVTMENDLFVYPDNEEYENMENDLHETILPAPKKIFKHLLYKSAIIRFILRKSYKHRALRRYFEHIGLVKNKTALYARKYSPELILASADKISEFSGKYNIMILIVPSRLLWKGTEDEKTRERKIHYEFIKELKLRGIPVIDMLEPLSKEGVYEEIHFPHDGHWTVKAHFKAGQELSDQIKLSITQ